MFNIIVLLVLYSFFFSCLDEIDENKVSDESSLGFFLVRSVGFMYRSFHFFV